MDIIELRQTANVDTNGDYQVSLANNPLILMPGDQLSIKNAFIDTKNINDNEIILPNPYTFELTVLKCNRNFFNSTAAAAVSPKIYKNNNYDHITLTDGDMYMVCNEAGISTDYELVNFVQLEYVVVHVKVKHGPVAYNFVYEGVDGNKHTKVLKIDTEAVQAGHNVINMNIVVKKGTLVAPDRALLKNNIKIDTFDTSPYDKVSAYKPRTSTVSFTLPAGNYTPDRFCEEFNIQLTSANPTSGNDIGSALLAHTKNYNSTNQSRPFVRTDGNGIFTYSQNYSTTDKPVLYGSNQCALEYDDQLGFFKFVNHYPLYNTTQIGVSFNDITTYDDETAGTASTTVKEPIGNRGCVLFTHLGCTDTITNESINFFQDELGFDLDNMLVSIAYRDSRLDNQDTTVPYLDITGDELQPGVNYSEAFLSVDNFVEKTDSNGIFDITALGFVQNNTIRYIFSETKFNEVIKNGYFLLEIDGGITQNMIGQGYRTHNISGIVSRYYSVGSYTTGGVESGIPYVNNGYFPIAINNFRVRILNGNRDMAEGLGSDNCIFLQHISAPPQLENKKN